MPRFSVPALESQFGQAAVTALTAAAGTLLPSAIDLNAARTMAAGSAEAIAD